MLADLCEKIYGPNARNAPKLLAHAHAFVACGPVGPEPGQTYLEFAANHSKTSLEPEALEEWKKFLASIIRLSVDKLPCT
jgi:hypothetical protein